MNRDRQRAAFDASLLIELPSQRTCAPATQRCASRCIWIWMCSITLRSAPPLQTRHLIKPRSTRNCAGPWSVMTKEPRIPPCLTTIASSPPSLNAFRNIESPADRCRRLIVLLPTYSAPRCSCHLRSQPERSQPDFFHDG